MRRPATVLKSVPLIVFLICGFLTLPSQGFSAVEVETTATSATVTEEQVSKLPVADPLDKFINAAVGDYLDSFTFDSIFNTYFVKGDRGRFRQDWFVDDRSTGGFRNIAFSGRQNGVSYEYEGRAVINYDYFSRLQIEKKDDFYVDTEWKSFRKYWDGSQDEPFDPTAYILPVDFPWNADNLHTDRGNIDVEFGKSISEDAKVIFKYELWTRKGRETLLKGEQANRANRGLNILRRLSMRRRVDGVSNKFTLAVPFTVNKIHNFEPSISFEHYKDSQFTDSARYNNGALLQKRDYIDKPSFADLRSQLKYDSFLTDNVYVHGGYAFNFLKNDSVRSEERLNAAGVRINTYVNPDVDNWRISNTVGLGAALLNFLKQKGLDLRLGVRGEHAITKAQGTLYARLLDRRESESSLNEGWFGEAASLTYRGIRRTTVFAGLDMEQRRLRWEEEYDARDHESITAFGGTEPFPRYKTNITYIDFVPKFKLTHRLNSKVKVNAQYKWQEKERQYDTILDNDPRFYPGVLGDMERRVHEITTSVDIKLPEAWTATAKYQLVKDDIDFRKVGNNQQDLDRHRISETLSGPIGQKLFAFLMGSYEYYRVDTPTDVMGNRWSTGTSDYDFIGDYFLITCNLNYQLMKNISTFLSYQVTTSMGDNRNALNEGATGFRYKISKTTSLEARYQVFNFRDNRGFDGGYDDDYYGHGMAFGLKKALG